MMNRKKMTSLIALMISATMALEAPLVAFASEGEEEVDLQDAVIEQASDSDSEGTDDAKDISVEMMMLVVEIPETEDAEQTDDATQADDAAQEIDASASDTDAVLLPEAEIAGEAAETETSDATANAGEMPEMETAAEDALPAAQEEHLPAGKGPGTIQDDTQDDTDADDSDTDDSDADKSDDEMIIERNTTSSELSSSSIYYKGLTTYIKGLTDDNYESVLKKFAENVPNHIYAGEAEKSKDTGKSYEVEDKTLIDPEKYSTYSYSYEKSELGYDGLLCWAAGATNMLWRSGYAQMAVNPITEDYFQNEDDLFNYFRYCFKDYLGAPDGATEYFFKGTYAYQDKEDFAELRDDRYAGGLLKGEAAHANPLYYDEDKVDDIIAAVNNLTDCSAALCLNEYSESQKERVGGHVVGLVGIVQDEKVDGLRKYKGLIIADSDDNPAIGGDKPSKEISWDARAQAAAGAKNVYAFYPITRITLGENDYWLINDYSENENIVYLDSIFVMMDYFRRHHRDEEDDQTDDKSDNSDNYSDSGSDEIQVITISEIINLVETFMEQHSMRMYSPLQTSYRRGTMDDFGVYVKAQRSKLGKVYLDGKLIHEGIAGYRIEMLSNGLFRIILGKELMQALSKENHQLKLEFDGTEDAVYVFTVN